MKKPKKVKALERLTRAALHHDVGQTAGNGDGTHCFHVYETAYGLRFCGRAMRWAGHQCEAPDHLYEPLYVALTRAIRPVTKRRKVALLERLLRGEHNGARVIPVSVKAGRTATTSLALWHALQAIRPVPKRRKACSYASRYKAMRAPTCGCMTCEAKWKARRKA